MNTAQVFQIQRERLLDDQVLAGPRRGHGLAGMIVGITADGHHIDVRCEHFCQIAVALDRAPVPARNICIVQLPRRVNRGDFRLLRAIDLNILLSRLPEGEEAAPDELLRTKEELKFIT